jgi:hypothetical protein
MVSQNKFCFETGQLVLPLLRGLEEDWKREYRPVGEFRVYGDPDAKSAKTLACWHGGGCTG